MTRDEATALAERISKSPSPLALRKRLRAAGWSLTATGKVVETEAQLFASRGQVIASSQKNLWCPMCCKYRIRYTWRDRLPYCRCTVCISPLLRRWRGTEVNAELPEDVRGVAATETVDEIAQQDITRTRTVTLPDWRKR